MDLTLNPALDLDDLSRRYRDHQRLQVRSLFTEDSAEAVLAAVEQLPWGVAFNEGTRVHQLDASAVERLSQTDRARLGQLVNDGARHGYQFIYSFYPILAAYFSPNMARQPIFKVYEFINSTPFLALVRQLTGLEQIRWADAQATMFQPGHFLKYHTDETPAEKRLAAYVINVTKGWGRDWGGYLNFFDAAYDVEQGYRPVFNAMNIFTIPADHSVSLVAPFASGRRFSITGWFRGDDPPGPIGP